MKKTFVIGVIILFVGVCIQPAFATLQPKDIYVEPKDYLFQTIIDIANNPEVKDIFEKRDSILIESNFELRGNLLKILSRCPRVLISTLFTKNRFSTDYLDLVYENGCKIVKIIGEENTLDIIESVEFKNLEIFEEINDIINDNSELKAKVTTLAGMNKNLKLDSPYQNNPIICAILEIIFISSILKLQLFSAFSFLFYNLNLFPLLREFFLLSLEIKLSLSMHFMIKYECIEWPPYE